MIVKKDYYDEFCLQINRCIELAENFYYKKLPLEVRLFLGFQDVYEKAVSDGWIKYLGGRRLTPEKLKNLSVSDAVKYTFIDGKVPIWINLYFEFFDDEYTYIRIVASNELSADESDLYQMPEGNKQFRIILPDLEEPRA